MKLKVLFFPIYILFHCSLACADDTSFLSSLPVSKNWNCFDAKTEIADAKIDVGNVRFNNFSFSESANLGYNQVFDAGVSFTFSVRNRDADAVAVDVQLIGFDADKKVIFVGRAGPQGRSVGPSTTETGSGSWAIDRGALDRVRAYCLQVRTTQESGQARRYGRRPY